MKQKIQIVETQEGLLPPPREYFGYWFMDMWIDAEPVGTDPLTGHRIYWGDRHEIAEKLLMLLKSQSLFIE